MWFIVALPIEWRTFYPASKCAGGEKLRKGHERRTFDLQIYGYVGANEWTQNALSFWIHAEHITFKVCGKEKRPSAIKYNAERLRTAEFQQNKNTTHSTLISTSTPSHISVHLWPQYGLYYVYYHFFCSFSIFCFFLVYSLVFYVPFTNGFVDPHCWKLPYHRTSFILVLYQRLVCVLSLSSLLLACVPNNKLYSNSGEVLFDIARGLAVGFLGAAALYAANRFERSSPLWPMRSKRFHSDQTDWAAWIR